MFFYKQGFLKFWGDGLLNNLGSSDEWFGEYCVCKDGYQGERECWNLLWTEIIV